MKKKKNQISRHTKSSRKLILIQKLLQSLFFLLIFTLILFFIGVEKSKYHRFHVSYFWYVNFMKSEIFWNAGVFFLHFLGQFTSKIQRYLFKVKFGIQSKFDIEYGKFYGDIQDQLELIRERVTSTFGYSVRL